MKPGGIPSVNGSVDEVIVPIRTFCNRLSREIANQWGRTQVWDLAQEDTVIYIIKCF